MFRTVQRLLTGAIVVAWLVLVGLLWQHSWQMGLATLGVGSVLLVLGARILRPPVQAPRSAKRSEDDARLLVTHLLRDLTRIQVAYLSQDFATADEGRRWLKRRLPRSYRSAIGQLHADLERARNGDPPEALQLAMRVMALRDELQRIEQALDEAARDHPDHAVARPVAFVITQNIRSEDADNGSDAQPLVVSVAGLDPERPTLLGPVDAVTFFTEIDGSRQVRGQADFDDALDTLSAQLEPLPSDEQGPTVYVNHPNSSSSTQLPRLSRVPLGFVVGASEFL